MNQQLNKDDITINGIPLKQLSEVSQKLFDKLVVLKKESDELQAKLQQKESAVKEISDMILEEVNQMKAAEQGPELSPVSEEEKLSEDKTDQV